MREGEFFGKRVVLTEAQWKACLRRVDVKGVRAGSYRWYIHADCPFCTAGERKCGSCPLGVFRVEDASYFMYGCLVLINRAGKEDCKFNFRTMVLINLSDKTVSWTSQHDKDARLVLKALYARFKRMKRTLRRK